MAPACPRAMTPRESAGADMLEKVYEKKKQYLRKRKVPEEGEEDWGVCPREPQR